jgi:predicted RNA-binding protein with EMAP domain
MINKDFYPTPDSLISKVTKNTIGYNTILEPSAGKGDLLKYFSSSTYDKKDIDVIEIEKDLQAILKEKGYNLVHDNFLTFETSKKYDSIIANFPFSNGDLHLLKAIEIQEKHGGLISCIINAETLRNPYTKTRQALANLLEKYNAEHEFIQNAFIDAERTTGVEIAIIHVTIPQKETKSLILTELQNAEEYQEEEHETKNEIEHFNNTLKLVARYKLETKAGVNLLQEYKKLKPFISRNGYPIIEIKNEDVNDFLERAREKYWRILLNSDEIRNKFTSNVNSVLENKIAEFRKKEFSSFNIETLKNDLNNQVSQSIDESIINLFDYLSQEHAYDKSIHNKNVHYFNGWKTNKAWKINSKVIAPIQAFSRYSWDKDKIQVYQINDKINDIVKTLYYIDGKQESFNFSEDREIDIHKNIELPYITITFFKKGTCHIVFRDKELLNQLNILGAKGKGWLPPSYGKKHEKDMTDEEKNVIINFKNNLIYEMPTL